MLPGDFALSVFVCGGEVRGTGSLWSVVAAVGYMWQEISFVSICQSWDN